MPDNRSLLPSRLGAGAPNSQDDRIRKIFGVSDESPIPPVGQTTLAVYYEHLAARLSFPFDALHCKAGGDSRHSVHHVQVTDLIDPRLGDRHDAHGLVCMAANHREQLQAPLTEFGVRDGSPNAQLIDDYAYWFANWR